MIKEFLATVLFAFSSGTPLTKTTPYKANLTQIVGMYNFRNEINYDLLENYNETTNTYIVLDTSIDNEETAKYTNPIRYNENDYWLIGIYLNVHPGVAVGIEFEWYDNEEEATTLNLTWYWNNDLNELENQDQENYPRSIYFNIRQSILADEVTTNIFNALFTHEDNWYIKNYTGWYSFSSTTQGISWTANMYGSITMGQTMYYSATINGNFIKAQMYDPNNDVYKYDAMALPFSTSQRGTQWYLAGAKMTNEDKTKWESVGTFAYIPKTQPGEYSLRDLFFSLADTPIYFIYSIFNWQLFGANLFIAFIGLVSFALILLLFRRFL